jgi:hypothetical protein
LALGLDGTLYAGGIFTTAGGGAANYVASWNGTAWSALGTGMNSAVYAFDIGPDGILYAVGVFTSAGGITLTDRMARWNGSSWSHLDVDLPLALTIFDILCSPGDPVIKCNYDVWVAFNTRGTGYFDGSVTVANDGSESVYPIIVFERSGGTSATIEQVRNETTGQELLFDYSLLDGETLTIDLRPTQQSIVSSMFGNRPDAILANSDMGSFTLQPGANQITSFVNVAGAPTITAWIEWRTRYWGL